MLPGQTYSLSQITRLLVRRWPLLAAPLAAGIVLGGLAYRWIPVQYRAETLIMVTPQRIPDSYVKSTVTANVEDRLRSVSEQILSRSRLERIIQDFDLYAAARKSGPLEDVILRMGSDIDVKLQGNESSFRVSYISADPQTAQKVTARLAALFIEENLRDRENLADSTNRFLDSQLQDAKERLIDQEKRLEEYRRRNAGTLPSQLPGNLQAAQSVQMQLQALNESMNRARERRLLIERQIADTQSTAVDTVVPASNGGENLASMSKAQQLEVARGRLAQLKQRYTLEHPDVLAQEQAIRDLEAGIEADASRPSTATAPVLTAAEAERQKRLRDFRAQMEIVDHQLATSQLEEARLKQASSDLSGKIAVVPTRESELVELTRDYGTLQATYAGLLQKREDSSLAANLERRQIGEQFRILDPAVVPERPANQKRRLMALLGGPVGGLTVGLLLIGLLEFRDGTFKREEDATRVLSLPVLALIPVMHGEPRADRRRLKARRLGSA